jgi:hypothetical protein
VYRHDAGWVAFSILALVVSASAMSCIYTSLGDLSTSALEIFVIDFREPK